VTESTASTSESLRGGRATITIVRASSPVMASATEPGRPAQRQSVLTASMRKNIVTITTRSDFPTIPWLIT